MKTLPVELAAIFDQRLGVEPYFVAKIWWGNTAEVYSTQAYVTELGTAIPHVKEFSGFTSSVRYDGFGAQNQITIELFDINGDYKAKYDSMNVFDRSLITCVIYLGAVGTQRLMTLFSGNIHDPVEWSEELKSLRFDVLEKPMEKEIGYAPNIADVSEGDPNYKRLRTSLTETPWPQVFGSVKYMPPALFARTPEVTTKSEVVYHTGDNPYVLTLEETEDEFPFETGVTYEVRLIGSDQGPFELKATGEFSISGAYYTFSFLPDNVTDVLYENIPVVVSEGSPGIGGRVYNALTMDVATYMSENNTDEIPYLRNTHLRLAAISDTTIQAYWVNCTDQDGAKLITDHPTFRQGTFVGTPTWPEYKISKVTKTLQPVTKFPAGTKIRLANWNRSNIYIVDSKIAAHPIPYIQTADGFKQISSAGYTIISTTGEDGQKLFSPSHPPCTYIKFKEEALSADQKSGTSGALTPVVSMSNIYNTDFLIIQKLLEGYEMWPCEDPIPMAFALMELEDLQDIVPEIAYQAARFVRFRDQKAEIVDLLAEPVVDFIFDDSNVLLDSVVLTSSNVEDVITRFDVTITGNNFDVDPTRKRVKVNVDKFGERTNSIDFYAFESKSTAEEYFEFWKNRLCWPWCKVKFTGFLNAFEVDVLDTVKLDFGPVIFKGDNNFQSLWNGIGLVEEVAIRPDEGLIDFTVRLPIKLGEIV